MSVVQRNMGTSPRLASSHPEQTRNPDTGKSKADVTFQTEAVLMTNCRFKCWQWLLH